MFLRSFVDSVNYLNIDFRCENCVCQQGGEFQNLQSAHGIPVHPSLNIENFRLQYVFNVVGI